MKHQTPDAAWSALKHQHGAGKPQPKLLPKVLPLRSVRLRPEVFQQRTPNEFSSKAHVRELAKHTAVLAAVVVWWDGKGWTCIDGHHRLEAYASKGEHHLDVSVEVFEGTPQQALLKSASANTSDKLPMGRSEKTNTAWRLVTAADFSKADIVAASGASDGTVGTMRKVKAKLESSKVTGLANMHWEAARRLAAGEAPDIDGDSPDWQEAKAQEIAVLLHRALGTQRTRQVEIFDLALEKYDQQLARGLREYWRSGREDDDESNDF